VLLDANSKLFGSFSVVDKVWLALIVERWAT